MKITPRQQEILAAIVQEYSKTGKPVASQELLVVYNFPYSPATIRAEMHNLEEKKFLEKPHTSAGRVPTDKGYRFYVQELMNQRSLQNNVKNTLKKKIQSIKREEMFSYELAQVMAELSENLVLVGEAKRHQFCFAGLNRLEEEIVFDILDFLETAEREFDAFFQTSDIKPSVFIGEDHPMLKSPRCGLVSTRFKIDEDEGVLALVGPSRMNYERNLSLLRYLNQILD